MIAWVFTGGTTKSFFICLFIYGIAMLIALSPVGEAILRFTTKAKEITTRKDKEYLLPIFLEVYKRALIEAPNLSKNISLYISEDMSLNAFAVGRNTIVLNRGIIETMSEDELRGILSHEFSHIINGDTKALLLSTIGNGFFSIFVLIADIFLRIISYEAHKGGIAYMIFVGLINLFARATVFIISWIGVIILSINSRQNEYRADEFASKIGYGEQLLSALYILSEFDSGQHMSFSEKLKASHPYIRDRIGRLENK